MPEVSLSNKKKGYRDVATYQNADIALLQETYSAKEVEHAWRSQWKGSLLFSHGTEHAREVLILVRENE